MLYALGDISFEGLQYSVPSNKVFRQIKSLFNGSDFVVGNLESPLLTDGKPVANKCVLKGDPEWAKVLYSSGIKLVSIANNHMMDFGADGLFSTMDTLQKSNIEYLGAGENLQEATKPLIKLLKGIKIAFLARTAVSVSSPSYAARETAGVAFLDVGETEQRIRECKQNADRVILLMHWGIENYNYPSPSQRRLAKRLINAGADIILGHHPHVLQGVEKIGSGLAVYSLGNFIFNDIAWSFRGEDGNLIKKENKLSCDNRKGAVMKIRLNFSGGIVYETVLTKINRDSSISKIQNRKDYRRHASLSKNLQYTFYDKWWNIYSLWREWDLRLKHKLSPIKIITNIWKIRPRHFRQAFQMLRRSGRVTSQKTTNPYD